MKSIEEIKYLLVCDHIDRLTEKKMKKRIYNETYKTKLKEKKRQMIEEIKKQRQENSVLFDNF